MSSDLFIVSVAFLHEKGSEMKECTKDLLHVEAKESQNSDPPAKDILVTPGFRRQTECEPCTC
jgi:hypothetical protein